MTRPRGSRLRDPSDVTFDFAPMVDIVLLLLIFFFLTSNLGARQNALPLDLPRASSTVQQTPDLPVVTVTETGKVFLNGYALTPAELSKRLPKLVRASGGTVGLRADEKGNYGAVVEVMDIIKQAGGERLAIGTRTP